MSERVEASLASDGRIFVSAGDPGRAAGAWIGPTRARELSELLAALAVDSEAAIAAKVVPDVEPTPEATPPSDDTSP